MPAWFVAILLGFIEGVTEFLPVSSTGHLLIAEHWLPRQSDLFNIVIQAGAVLAVLPLFRERVASFFKDPTYALKLLAAFFVTGVGGLVLDKLGFELPEETVPVAVALVVVGALFIVVERWV